MSKIGKSKKLLEFSVEACNKFGFIITVDDIKRCYSEPHRYWHTLKHLYDLLLGINELYEDKKLDDREYTILLISAIFHDIVYNPKRNDNEEKSVEYMMSFLDEEKSKISKWRRDEDTKKISEVILNTKNHDSKDGLCKKFNKIDNWILDAQFIDMIDWENAIYQEYKWAGWKRYKKKRIEFLLRSIKNHTHNVINIKNLIDYLELKNPKIGILFYEIDKMPSIEDYVNSIQKINNLFDNITILIVYNKNNYNKEIIKEYSKRCKNNEFEALEQEDAISYLEHQKDITIIKEFEVKEYNNKLEEFRTIYI